MSTSRGTAWFIAIVFAVLFAAPLFWGVSDLIEYPAYAGGRTPWLLLILGVVVPVAAYVGAALVARGRTPLLRVVVFAAGLGVASGVTISVIAWALSRFALLG
jgi:predicted membrane-bound mannosyltransferase